MTERLENAITPELAKSSLDPTTVREDLESIWLGLNHGQSIEDVRHDLLEYISDRVERHDRPLAAKLRSIKVMSEEERRFYKAKTGEEYKNNQPVYEVMGHLTKGVGPRKIKRLDNMHYLRSINRPSEPKS